MNVLIIGGTRNLGYFLAKRLLEENHRVTILNRGITEDPLPEEVARLRADRTYPNQMRRALAGREFDLVVDTVLYKPAEAENIVEILKGQIGQYVFISTGQVYLVRDGITFPAKEEDYEGPLKPEPEPNTYDYEEWLYGMEKRQVEDVMLASEGFPYTSLRLPMVNSERDTFNRLYGYILRLKDGGPILIPKTPNHPLRHIYAGDVVEAIMRILKTGTGKQRAYNISQDETLSINEFLMTLGDVLGIKPHIKEVERNILEANGFLPDCSPFSDMWMSVLDNTRSKTELGMTYTPMQAYLTKIVDYYKANPPSHPASYRRRHAELTIL